MILGEAGHLFLRGCSEEVRPWVPELVCRLDPAIYCEASGHECHVCEDVPSEAAVVKMIWHPSMPAAVEFGFAAS